MFHAFCGWSDRAPHHASTVPKDAHARAQLAEYAKIPPLITLIRPHGATHDLLHGRLQARLERAQKARRSESSRLALPRRTRLVSSGKRAGDGGRRARSRGPLSRRWHHAHLIIAHLSASKLITKKLSKCRQAPDAQRGCPPVTAVTRASSPFIPEAGAAPRHLSSGGQVGGGCLGAVWP